MKKQPILKILIFTLALSITLSGCSANFFNKNNVKKPEPNEKQNGSLENINVSQDLKNEIAKQSKIKKFESVDEFAAFLEDAESNNNYYSRSGGIMSKGLSVEADFASDMGLSAPVAKNIAAEESSAGSGSKDFSKTNVQVEGVDEADIIKTDGEYIYAVAQGSLYIAKAYPAKDAEVLSKIEFKSYPQDIYINGDRLVVFGDNSQIYQSDYYRSFRRQGNYTFFKIFDISDKKNPKQVRDLDFEGYYTNSRMIGDYVYFITNNYSYYYIAGEPIVPRILENGEDISVKCGNESVKCLMPDIYYFDMPYDSYNLTIVAAINIKNQEAPIKSDIYTLSGNQNMYVSQENIYITYTKYISEYQLGMEVMKEIVFPLLSSKNQERIKEIEKTSNYILSENEKQVKVAQILERYTATLSNKEVTSLEKKIEEALKNKYEDITKELEKTIIHKIGIKNGDLEYKTFGEAPGYVLNQFSMDEKDGYFRIATTKGQTWSQYLEEEERQSYSNLYVLDSDLKVVGSVQNLAPGERIYSVRFMQNRAYMVTFKQTDPLFTIDLSDPKNPKVLGQLKIPGFSSYLHPYNDNLLIGFGKDTAEGEWGGVVTKGLKLSLFDVSDITNPKEVDTYIMGDAGSDSPALNDHKAFLFSREKNLLVLPVTIREKMGEDYWGRMTFNGAAVFDINEKGIELKGKINHNENEKIFSGNIWEGYEYDANVQRSLYINDTLYTFSNKYLKANKISDLAEIKKLELKKERKGEDGDIEIIN